MNARDLAHFSKAVLTLQECRSSEELGSTLIRAMRALCEVDFPMVNGVHGDRLNIYAAGQTFPAEWMEIFNAHIHEHPLLRLIQRKPGEPTSAGRWSDFLMLRSFRQTGLYHDFFRPRGVRRQLATTMDVDGKGTLGLVFSRAGRDFRAEDARLLEMFLPHVQRLIQDLISRVEMKEALALRDVAMNGEAIMLVDEDGALIFATERARRLARNYFAVHGEDGLPVEMRSWLQNDPVLGQVRTWERVGGRLTCTCGGLVRRESYVDEICGVSAAQLRIRRVRLAECREAQSVQALQSAGLTPREAEVLHWMAEGKRNGEIAVILGISERTVDKHRENLFAKLSVETRTAAVAAAQAMARFQE